MKNKTLDNIHCFVTVALCVMCLLLGRVIYERDKTISEYKQITADAIQVAEECLMVME